MKKIYFIQVGFDFDQSVYLPYAAGSIIAYCKQNLKNKNEYEFSDIIFTRKNIDEVINGLDSPYIVAFSCSVWNIEYNKALASEIKKSFPETIIVFGGHSVSENAELLKSENYIDVLIFGEGEQSFCSFLDNLCENNIGCVNNIAYCKNGEIIRTPRKSYPDIAEYPSAYTTGVFDKIIEDNPDIDFLSVLETNRGCPYNCAYCDWCSGRKVRFFSMKKILGEIRWLSEKKISYCFCADSNFGMFDRDFDIAVALIKAKKATGYPEVFRPCYEKNSDERVFKICKALNEVDMDKGATLAYQTLNHKALENIGRKNLTMEHFSGLMKKYNEANIPTYSELILGLPGETLESFCKGICCLIENGQHNSVSVYHCEVLPNSDLSDPEYIRKHKIEVIKVEFNHIHSAIKKQDKIQEYSYLVRSTATLSRDDWVNANLFSICVQCFHSLGILRCFAIYMNNAKNMSYYDFYSSLLNYIMNGKGTISRLFLDSKRKYESSLSGSWNYSNVLFGNVTWFFEEGIFLEIINDFDKCFSELIPFIESLNIETVLLNDMIKYQKMIIRKPMEPDECTMIGYDFNSYYGRIYKSEKASLKKGKFYLKINPDYHFENIEKYAKEVVWYGRRRGRTLYNSSEIELRIERR